MLVFSFLLLSAAVAFVAFAPVRQAEPDRLKAEHAAMLARLRDGLAKPHLLSGIVIEYFADRFRHEHVAHWARISFQDYLNDPVTAEAVTRARRAAEATRHAELAAALDLQPERLARATFALN